jgi:hypothetical protein
MRGYKQFNFPAFDQACHRIRQAGHVAIGPQELDRLCGMDEFTEDGFIGIEELRKVLLRDLMMIVHEVDGLALLRGWEESRGALAEVALARALRLPLYDEYLNLLHLRIDIRSWQT